MRIKSLKLENIRCFEKLNINFLNVRKPKDWIMVLGDNGVGKSTILRSLALGLTEESGASGLLAEFGSDWIRRGHKEGVIIIELEPYEGCTEKAEILTRFEISDFNEVKVRQKVNPENPESFNWDTLFVCGYGAGRGIDFTESYPDYIVTDAVYTLFKYTQPLQNPELNIRRIMSLGIKEREIFSIVEKILMLPENSVNLEYSGIMVSGPWGEKIPLDGLGDGYISTLGWLMDLFGWKSLFEGRQQNFDKQRIVNMDGIVLIDELEQHLHPRWQKKIVRLLNEQFPRIQFITTSHSPLNVIGTTDLQDEQCAIVVLEQEGEKVSSEMYLPPRGKRVDQVLTSYMFDLYTTSDDKIKDCIERYNHLFNKDRDESEEVEMQNLISYLNETLGSEETKLEKEVGQILDQSINSLFEKKIIESLDENAPQKYELIRQLKNLMD